jgi:predicted MFS family arabinose efflux permease
MTQAKSSRNYLVITAGYWAFTITDGAIRMLVVLYFHQLGYTPLAIASLFLFYEFFGIITNLVGGWLGARIGLNATMHIGMGLQVLALGMLAVDPSWLSIPYVMAAQALSGIAKDLNKMSAKASVKLMLPKDAHNTLFKWVTVLTGSKNTLKGGGFFIGALLLSVAGFRGALIIMASLLLVVLVITWILLPCEIGKTAARPKFSTILSKSPAVNWLSGARFFLFGARDIWFVVALPVFLSTLGWSSTSIGGFIALWIIGYGLVQASSPKLLKHSRRDGTAARQLAFILSAVPAAMAVSMHYFDAQLVVISGLAVFGILFALNSALHSYLIVAWSERDHVSMNVGFYYMANAGGRLTGTLLSGWVYQVSGMTGCLWWSCAFLLVTWLISFGLPSQQQTA